MKGKFKLIYIPLILILLAGTLCIGITDYITAGFDFAKLLQDPTFFLNIGLTNLGILCIIIVILVFKNDKYKEEDVTYNDLKKEISAFHKTRYHSPVFKLFLAEYNLDNKRKTYLAKINKKASRLKPTQNDLDIVYTHSDDPEQELYLESIRMKNKYYNKLKYYDHLLSKEYVDQNIHRLNVKYDRINEAMIFNEHSLSGTESEGFIRHKVLKVTKELLPRYLMSFALICLVTAVTIEVREGITISVVFNTISKLFTICCQIFFINNYADVYNIRYTLHDMQYRKSILSAYDMWEKKQIKKVGE